MQSNIEAPFTGLQNNGGGHHPSLMLDVPADKHHRADFRYRTAVGCGNTRPNSASGFLENRPYQLEGSSSKAFGRFPIRSFPRLNGRHRQPRNDRSNQDALCDDHRLRGEQQLKKSEQTIFGQ